MSQRILGLDIGGANLKAALNSGRAAVEPFALWKDPAGLAAKLAALLCHFEPIDALAVTMTGELCDCFHSRSEGVQRILDAVEKSAGSRAVRVWSTAGKFCSISAARREPRAIASANWLALARYAGRLVPHGPAMLIDMGSTTTDLVPLIDGTPTPRARTDRDRLMAGELLYHGVGRTPFFALLPEAHTDWQRVRLIPEFFATTRDAYLELEDVAEDEHDQNTADGRPATRACARARVARHLGADAEDVPPDELMQLCRELRDAQLDSLTQAILAMGQRAGEQPVPVIAAGSGEFLVRKALARLDWNSPVISLAERLGPTLSAAAPAYAVAVLAAEESQA